MLELLAPRSLMLMSDADAQDGGVVVAEVQTDNDKHDVSVQSHEEINIYQSTKTLQISGTGFLPGMKVGCESGVLANLWWASAVGCG